MDLFARPLCLARQLQRVLGAGAALVRVAPPLLLALRRMQRIMQVGEARQG